MRGKLRDWNVFPNAIFSNLELVDCDKSTTGYCINADTYKDCIKICEQQGAKVGYFIETPDRDNICVPLNVYREKIATPYHRITSRDNYPILKSMNTYVFSKYPFPPELSNAIFYFDSFNLGVGDKKISSSEILTTTLSFTGTPINLEFIPQYPQNTVLDSLIVIRSGDTIAVNIPKTSYLLHVDGDNIQWLSRANTINTPSNLFKIFGRGREIGDILSYNDKVYFTYNDKSILYSGDKLILSSDKKTLFDISPNFLAYYCNGEVSMTNTDKKDYRAFYKGFPVYRERHCWDLCDKKRYNYTPFVILIIFIFFLVYLYKFKKNMS